MLWVPHRKVIRSRTVWKAPSCQGGALPPFNFDAIMGELPDIGLDLGPDFRGAAAFQAKAL